MERASEECNYHRPVPADTEMNADGIRIALTISSGIVRLWIDSVFTQHGEKLKDKHELLTRESQPVTGERNERKREREREIH